MFSFCVKTQGLICFSDVHFCNCQVHTEELQRKATTSLFPLICSMYKVQLMPQYLKALIQAWACPATFLLLVLFRQGTKPQACGGI